MLGVWKGCKSCEAYAQAEARTFVEVYMRPHNGWDKAEYMLVCNDDTVNPVREIFPILPRFLS